MIGGSIPLIGIIITQYLIYKQVQAGRVSEKRIEHIIEGHKDNTIVSNCLTQIETRMDVKNNIDRIQQIVGEHPYNFSFGFLLQWSQIKDTVGEIPPKDGVKVLLDNLTDMRRMFYKKYLLEVLDYSKDEIREYAEALKGTMDIERINRDKMNERKRDNL